MDEIGALAVRPLEPDDEGEHPDSTGDHVEAWWWWGAGVLDDGRYAGLFVGLEVRDRRFDYWAGFVREGEPYLYIEELDGVGRRAGLELKPPEMWAGHECDVPFQQWSVGNEAHGVLLDDPTEAWRQVRGEPVPTTFDVEWHAVAPPTRMSSPGSDGYAQDGEVDARIELREGVVAVVGPARRVHVWGGPYLPRSFAMPIDHLALRAPYRRHDGLLVDQGVTVAGGPTWWGRVTS